MNILFDSGKTKIIQVDTADGKREMIERVPAVAILAFDENGKVLLVQQERGHFGKILEVPAGKVDEGETPYEAAMRELEEETGYVADNLVKLTMYYPSVGYTTERIFCFLATRARPLGKQRLDDEERINVYHVALEDLQRMIKMGDLADSKIMVCLLGLLFSEEYWGGKK